MVFTLIHMYVYIYVYIYMYIPCLSIYIPRAYIYMYISLDLCIIDFLKVLFMK